MDASPLPGHPEPLFGDDMLPLPEMMFAAGEEPVGVRVLTYQSSRSINHILESLEDDEIQTLRMSPFWKIVEISEKPSFSGRFARFMLSRQLKVEKKHEAWFRFAGKPIRFSIREFAIVTGLNCGEYPKNSKRNAKVKRKAKPYWPELFGRSDELRVTTALKNLRRKTITDKEVRIKLACLAIVSSVLLATNLKMKMIKEHADTMVDLEEFFSFPWGRLAFEMLMGSIKQRNEVSLSTDTIAVKGFALALQLVMVEAVPALTEVFLESYSSSDSDSSNDGDDFFQKKNRQKTLSPGHARDLDKTKDVVVRSIIPEDPDRPIIAESLQWEDEVMDVKVDNLLKLIAQGQRGGKRKRKSIPVKEKETDEEKRIASIVSSMLQSEFERVDASVANAVSLSDKTAKEVEALERRIMVSIQNELQNFKEEVIRSVMEVHNKANGRTVTTGPNVNSSNNEVREGDNAVPQRDPYAADRGVDARTSTAANPASPIPYVVQPNVPSSHDPPLSATSENNGSTKIASGGVQIGNTVHQPISRDMSEGSNHDMPTRSYNSHAINPPAAVVASSSARLREEQNPLPYATGFVQSMDTRAEHGEEDSNEEALLPPSSPKTKRHKTLPSDAVIETNPRSENLTVNPPAANPFNAYSDIDVVMSKYTKLCQKLSQSFVINVAGLAVTSTYLTAIAELKHSLPARMGQLILVSSGDWTKGPDGIWRFEVAPSEEEHYILARNDKIPGVMSLVREELGIGKNTPMILSYHLPRSLRPPVGCTAPPNYVLTTQDLRFLLTLQEWTKEVELCVTFGALNVAHYQFLRRESFTIGDRTFLSDGMTEEDTVAAILDCPISPDGYHRPGTPHHSYVESENDDGRQNSDYDRRQTGGDEDCNDFINLDLEVVDVGESSTGSTPNSFTNNYFHMHNDVYNENCLDNDHGWYQRCSSLETNPGAESFVLRATEANSINIDLTVEENSVQLEESKGG
ncbi:unnamed protein product [Brassica rapa]|uniref:DUF1985 domain-containing protein n=3 Tax=Brassica TaxID=3705 RepID=A0A8D9HUW9_BRACM|nr:unnamed protein product [Brassica napus]CAG7906348.1 unnamed protein product [Brassica rapa]